MSLYHETIAGSCRKIKEERERIRAAVRNLKEFEYHTNNLIEHCYTDGVKYYYEHHLDGSVALLSLNIMDRVWEYMGNFSKEDADTLMSTTKLKHRVLDMSLFEALGNVNDYKEFLNNLPLKPIKWEI